MDTEAECRVWYSASGQLLILLAGWLASILSESTEEPRFAFDYTRLDSIPVHDDDDCDELAKINPTLESSPYSPPMSISVPSSRRHMTYGSGYPLALHCSVTLEPSRTTISLLVCCSRIDGGTAQGTREGTNERTREGRKEVEVSGWLEGGIGQIQLFMQKLQ